MAIDFAKILGKQAESVEKPKPLPVGTYLCNNPEMPKFIGVGKAETPCAEFGLIVLAPQDDVDPTELQEFGNWKGKSIRHRMFLTDASEYRTIENLEEAFGIDKVGKTLGQMFNETKNRQVLVKIKHRPSDDGTEIFHEVESLAAA